MISLPPVALTSLADSYFSDMVVACECRLRYFSLLIAQLAMEAHDGDIAVAIDTGDAADASGSSVQDAIAKDITDVKQELEQVKTKIAKLEDALQAPTFTHAIFDTRDEAKTELKQLQEKENKLQEKENILLRERQQAAAGTLKCPHCFLQYMFVHLAIRLTDTHLRHMYPIDLMIMHC